MPFYLKRQNFVGEVDSAKIFNNVGIRSPQWSLDLGQMAEFRTPAQVGFASR
jgi:hypothetical protein